MSGVSELNIPPEEIYKSIFGARKNVEHIILWMLKNNEVVEWDLIEVPVKRARPMAPEVMASRSDV